VPSIPADATLEESEHGFTYDADDPERRWRFNKRGHFERYIEYSFEDHGNGPERKIDQVISAAGLAKK
jgi:hypothetical protein